MLFDNTHGNFGIFLPCSIDDHGCIEEGDGSGGTIHKHSVKRGQSSVSHMHATLCFIFSYLDLSSSQKRANKNNKKKKKLYYSPKGADSTLDRLGRSMCSSRRLLAAQLLVELFADGLVFPGLSFACKLRGRKTIGSAGSTSVVGGGGHCCTLHCWGSNGRSSG